MGKRMNDDFCNDILDGRHQSQKLERGEINHGSNPNYTGIWIDKTVNGYR